MDTRTTVGTLLDSISDCGQIRFIEFCQDLTEGERQLLKPYVQWVGTELWITPEGIELTKVAA